MNFLKNLFASASSGGDKFGRFYYVRPKHCKEVLQVRVNLMNDLSRTDDGGYYCRKIVRGRRCPFPAELHLYFDKGHKLINSQVDDGELVSEEDYEAFVAASGTPASNT